MRLKLVLLFVLVGAVSANAALIQYLDQGSWLAAVSSVTTATFDDATAQGTYTPPSPGFSNNIPGTGLLDDGILFEVLDHATEVGKVTNPGSVWTAAGYGTLGDYLKDLSANSSSRIHITLPANVTAWSTLFGFTFGPATAPIIWNGPTLCTICTPTGSVPSVAQFFGITSDTPISTIDLYFPTGVTSGYMMIDNFSIGTASGGGGTDSPEICTMLLCGSGLLGLVKLSRRMQSRQSCSAA